MGLSDDPEVRARQLANLEAGRKIARARREAGLPPRKRPKPGGPAVVPGEYSNDDNDEGANGGRTQSREARESKPSEAGTEADGGDGAGAGAEAGADAGGPDRFTRVIAPFYGVRFDDD